MQINVERNSQILDFVKFNDFFPVLCSHLCFQLKRKQRKDFLCELLEAHSLVDRLSFSTLKILAKETTHRYEPNLFKQPLKLTNNCKVTNMLHL